MIGRLRVVAELTPSQMCSARWEMQYIAPACRLQHLAGPGVDLPRHEERDQDLGVVTEVVTPGREVVLVAAVAVAGRVGVVLEEVDDAADALLPEALLGRAQELLEDALPRLVVGDEVEDRVALGRGVLRVGADVEVQAGAVGEEDVAAATPRHDPSEEVAGHLVGAQAALAPERARDAVLVLESEDPALHAEQPTWATTPIAYRSLVAQGVEHLDAGRPAGGPGGTQQDHHDRAIDAAATS